MQFKILRHTPPGQLATQRFLSNPHQYSGPKLQLQLYGSGTPAPPINFFMSFLGNGWPSSLFFCVIRYLFNGDCIIRYQVFNTTVLRNGVHHQWLTSAFKTACALTSTSRRAAGCWGNHRSSGSWWGWGNRLRRRAWCNNSPND